MHGTAGGRGFPETGADPCREACAQLHDGHAVDQKGIIQDRFHKQSNNQKQPKIKYEKKTKNTELTD